MATEMSMQMYRAMDDAIHARAHAVRHNSQHPAGAVVNRVGAGAGAGAALGGGGRYVYTHEY